MWKMMRLIFARGKEETSIANSALLSAFHEILLVRPYYYPDNFVLYIASWPVNLSVLIPIQ